ncbi:MAG: SAM-dependent DNA methyltransferase, partial [Deltaproteobacteria bacterium]|nr:SAM-dependent DNA methyltransferase [Deltaproteobacteria bacterium]
MYSIYTPENIKNTLKQSFIKLGYPEDHIRLDWQFVHPDFVESDPAKKPHIVDLAAFTHPLRHNLDTTSIVAKIEKGYIPSGMSDRKQIAEGLTYTLAPVLILVDSQQTDIWVTGIRQISQTDGYELQHWKTFKLDEFTTEFPKKYRREFSPQALARVRGGQLTFFDMGYLDFSGLYNVTRETLVEHFHEGVIKARQLLRKTEVDVDSTKEALSRVAISLLAARILEDKDYFGDSKIPTLAPHELLEMASHKADAFFTHTIENDLRLFSDEVLQPLMAHLAGSITFRGVTEEMIGYFYEKALVSERRKRATGKKSEMRLKGIHYTPLKVAHNMLNRLSIETIRPEKRHIIDPTCGSGSFLLAATDRLDNLYDKREISFDKKTYLENYVTGNDSDLIAIQVARLSYLLNHVSKGNHGEPIKPNLMAKDALTLTKQNFEHPPSIIVGNPPFGEDPEQRDQIATRFLNNMLELLPEGGYLAMIMPQSFLNGDRQGCPEVRRKLLASCELLEVWKMPEGAVGLEAEYPTAAILAFRSNGDKNKSPVRIYQTVSRKNEAVSAIYEHGRFTFSSVVPNTQSWREYPKDSILTSPLDTLWDSLQNCRRLEKITVDWSGINT